MPPLKNLKRLRLSCLNEANKRRLFENASEKEFPTNEELKNRLYLMENKNAELVRNLEASQTRIRELEKEVLDCKSDLASKNSSLLGTKVTLRESEKEKFAMKLSFERKTAKKKHVKSTAPNSKKREKLSDCSSKFKTSSAFEKVIEFMRTIIDPPILDDFVTKFIHNIADSKDFSFRLKMTEKETEFCKTRFKWTDPFMKQFKAECRKLLGFDILCSRDKANAVLKEMDPKEHYDIRMVEMTRKTSQDKVFHEMMPVVTIRNIKKRLEDRLSVLEKSGRLLEGDFVIGIGGDKGGDSTKLCLIIQNVDHPNNPQGILLLGWYHGSDNHENLERYMGPVFDQINYLKFVEVDGATGKKKLKVSIKAIGDCLFMSSMQHHPGPSSSTPCFICSFKYVTHGSEKELIATSKFHLCHTVRSLSCLLSKCRPLLHLDPEDYGIPPVHTIHGVTQKFTIDPLLALANKLDVPGSSLPDNLSEQKAYFKEVKEREEVCLRRCQDLQNGLTGLELLKTAYEKIGNSTRQNVVKSKCASSICVASHCKGKKLFDRNDFHKCPKCKGLFHKFCLNIVTSNEKHEISNGTIHRVCNGCELGSLPTVSSQIQHLASVRTALQVQLDEDELEFCTVNQERKELEAQLKQSNGPIRKKLEEALRQIGCDQRIWYQEMTGNQIRKLLRSANIQKIIDVFPDSKEIRMISNVLNELSFLMTNSDNANKSDALIDEMEKSVNRLVVLLRELHPQGGVTLKLHLMAAHLVPYVRKNRNWGRISEQGIESLHAVMNQLNRRYASVRNQELKCTLILQNLMNLNFLFDVGQTWEK